MYAMTACFAGISSLVNSPLCARGELPGRRMPRTPWPRRWLTPRFSGGRVGHDRRAYINRHDGNGIVRIAADVEGAELLREIP
jgi:hypothetical protein